MLARIATLLLLLSAAALTPSRSDAALRAEGVATSSPAQVIILRSLAFRNRTEARLVGEQGTFEDPLPSHSNLRSAAQMVRSALGARRDTDSLRDYALLCLVRGDTDGAVDALRAANALAPEEARILSDLSAAYLERAVQQRRPIDLLYALGAAERALQREAFFLPGLYNKALVLERLNLDLQAARTWTQLLREEPAPSWREKAQEHLEHIARQITDGFQLVGYQEQFLEKVELQDQEALRRLLTADSRRGRYAIEEVFLARWAEAVLKREPAEAARHLSSAAIAAHLYTEVTGDPFLQDTTNSIAEVVNHSPATVMRALARSHQGYALAREHMAVGEYAEALALFSAIEAQLTTLRGPFVLRVRLGRASASYFLGNREVAREWLTSVRETAVQKRFVALAGDSSWLLGLCDFAESDFANAQEAYELALAFFRSTNETESIAGAHNLIAETLDRQGAFEEGWRHRYQALELLSTGSDPLRLYQLYAVSAISAVAKAQPEVALAFQQGAVAQARRLGNPVALTHALMWQARYEARAGDLARARAAAEEAKATSAQIPDAIARGTAEVGALLAQAEVAQVKQPLAALELLGDALSFARVADSSYHVVDIHFLRSRLWERLGEPDAAVEELDRCIDALEGRKTRIRDLARHLLVVDQSRAAFDRAARLQVGILGKACKAFEYVERRRARESEDLILDLPGGERQLQELNAAGSAEWLGCDAARRSLSAGEAIVSYVNLEGKLYAWLLTRSSVRFARIAGKPREIKQSMVGLQNAALGRGEPAPFHRWAVALGKTLLEPLQLDAARIDRIAFVVDPPFDGIPYAALVNPMTGRYLVRDHVVVTSPSVAAYLSAVERRESGRQKPVNRVAFLGDPAFDRASMPSLSPLPRAREQSVQNARLYEEATVLLGSRVTVMAFRREAARVRILQFAGHAKVQREAPMWSRLILAPGLQEADRAYLTAGDIYSLDMRNAALVVLAMCGEMPKEEGLGTAFVGPFARAFLGAGVPGVVATMWPIEDGDTAGFLQLFHEVLSKTGDPTRALQVAQSEFSKRPESTIWAAFQFVGA